MYSTQIADILLSDKWTEPIFQGVYAANTLPRHVQLPALLVVNTDTSEREGTHWVAMYISAFGRGEFFDSFGFPPIIPQHRHFMDNNCSSWTYNTVQLQGIDSSVCGEYCVLFLTHRARGLSMEEFLWFFSVGDESVNDLLVQVQFKKKFSKYTIPLRRTMLKNQYCRSGRESGFYNTNCTHT